MKHRASFRLCEIIHCPLALQRSITDSFAHREFFDVDPPPDKDAPEPKPSRSEEARRVVAEYADGLRQIIKKLRRED